MLGGVGGVFRAHEPFLMVQDSFCLEIRPKFEPKIRCDFLTENARLGSFLGRFGRNKVAYATQGTMFNEKPTDTMPVSVLVKEPIHR